MATTRTTPRTTRRTTARNTAQETASSGNGSAQTHADAAVLPFDVELARRVVGSTLGGVQTLLHCLGEVQHVNALALDEMATILDRAVDEARNADDAQQLLTLQFNLVNTQVARAAQAWGSLLARCLDNGTQFAEQALQEATRLVGPAAGSGAALAAPAHPWADASALALLGSAQEAMTQLTGQWIEMAKDASARAQLAQL